MARKSAHEKPAFTLPYAAPEAVEVAECSEEGSTMSVSEKLDAWSLGVVAFELLTGFEWAPTVGTREQVRSRDQNRGFKRFASAVSCAQFLCPNSNISLHIFVFS